MNKKKLYNAIMEQVAYQVKKMLVEHQSKHLNEEKLENIKKKIISDVYFCLNNFVDYHKAAKRNEVDSYTGIISKIEEEIINKYSSRDMKHAEELLSYLKENPEALDVLLNKNSYFYFANKEEMKHTGSDIDKKFNMFRRFVQLNDTEDSKKLASDRKENKNYSDNLFKNDFDETKNNYGLPKVQDPKKFAFAAFQLHTKYISDEQRNQSDNIARELGYSSWKDAFVNYGLNTDCFILEYVQGEQGGGKQAEEYAKKNWNFNKYAFTTRFAEQWVFPENFDPEQFMIDCCRVRLDNKYIENCKFVAKKEVMNNMKQRNYNGYADRLEQWKNAFKK